MRESTTMNEYEISWSDIAFGNKKPLRELKATFIAAPRAISKVRFTQLIKQYLPIGNIVVGCADEQFIAGFDGQAQFKTLQASEIRSIVDKVNKSASPHKITLLHYRQSDALPIYSKIKFRSVVLINGSWQYSFHTRPEYYALVSAKIPFEFVSPFTDETEAKAYAEQFQGFAELEGGAIYTDSEMLAVANNIAKESFDCAFQTGVALGKKTGNKYKLLVATFNPVVPYQTFAWHFGPLRERHLSPPGDLNYYDTVHAEVMMLVQAQKSGIKLKDTSLFINLLPCPTCARMLCATDIAEVVYSLDHSDGYAVALLEKAGKTVRRFVKTDELLKEG